MIRIQRVYEAAAKGQEKRFLVERLWPRGVTKQKAALDLWLKDVAPSSALRTWYGHDPAKWPRFRERYWKELASSGEAVEDLKQKVRKGTVTFVYAARDERHNGALALKEFLELRKGRGTRSSSGA